MKGLQSISFVAKFVASCIEECWTDWLFSIQLKRQMMKTLNPDELMRESYKNTIMES